MMYYQCPVCKGFNEVGEVECKRGMYHYILDLNNNDSSGCGKYQRLLVPYYHETCYLRVGGTNERCEAVNESLVYESNTWLETESDSVPVQDGGIRLYEPIGDPTYYAPGGTQILPRDYEKLRRLQDEYSKHCMT